LNNAVSLLFSGGARYTENMASFYSFFRAILIILLLLMAAIVVPFKVLDQNGLDRVERLRTELQTLNEANARLKRENDALRLEIHTFHANPNYIEKVARDELGMVGPNEVIYQFPSEQN
jgi:cell division protein FtsB